MENDEEPQPPSEQDVNMSDDETKANDRYSGCAPSSAPAAAAAVGGGAVDDPVQLVVQEVMTALALGCNSNSQPHTDSAYRSVTRAIRRFGYLRHNLTFNGLQTLVVTTLLADSSPRHSTPGTTTGTATGTATGTTRSSRLTSAPAVVAALTTTASLNLLDKLELHLKNSLSTLNTDSTAAPTETGTRTNTSTGDSTAATGVDGTVDDQQMQGDTADAPPLKKPPVKLETVESWVNAVAYQSLLVLTKLIDKKLYSKAVELSDSIVGYVESLPRKLLDDNIAAKLFFFHSRSYELNGNLKDVRPTMLAAYRFACMHHDSTKQAVALNCLLRNYILYRHYHLAIKMVSKAVLPEDLRNNSQTARFLYYLGRLQAVQQDYSDAHASLTEAIGKAPVAAPPPIPLPTLNPAATGKSKDTTGAAKENKDKNDKTATGTDSKKTGTDSKKTGTDSKKTGTDSKKTGTDSKKTGTDSKKTGTDSKKT
eukprot:Lankesteria_metandrocarpae@DN10461_c0_g1_i1.p1